MTSVSGVSPSNYDYTRPCMAKETLLPGDSLTFEETRVLNEVKEILAQYGFEDKIVLNKGKLQHNGMTIEAFGFIGSVTEESGYFSMGTTFLKRMATDPDFKREMLEGVREQAKQQKQQEEINKSYMPEKKTITIPSRLNSPFAVDEDIKRLYSKTQMKAVGKITGLYASNFSYM